MVPTSLQKTNKTIKNKLGLPYYPVDSRYNIKMGYHFLH